MRRVGVIGGGQAGVEAALAAAREGARVTLFETSPRLPSPRSEWPEFLGGHAPSARMAEETLTGAGVESRCGQPVSEVEVGLGLVSPSGRQRFDSVVVSTGTKCIPVTFPGSRKPGVHVLANQDSYLGLEEACLGYSRVMVAGTGPTALGVADALTQKGIKVTIAAPGGMLRSHFCSLVREFVLRAATEHGLPVLDSPVRKAIGVDRVEAALVGSEVLPCDGIVAVPNRMPSAPRTPAETGPQGGVAVDSHMRSTVAGLYAAGGCTERRPYGLLLSLMPGVAAKASGAVAGANAAGGGASLTPVGVLSSRILGLSVASAGLTLDEALAAGYDVLEASSIPDEDAACSMVFEAGSRRILGVQYAGRDDAPTPELFTLMVSKGVLLGDLARLEHTGSNDISPILEAASEGMRHWQRS